MAFRGFSGNTGPVAPPKAPISFGSEHPSAPQKNLRRSPPSSPYSSPSSLSPPRPRSRSPNPRTPSPPRPPPHIHTQPQLNEADKSKPLQLNEADKAKPPQLNEADKSKPNRSRSPALAPPLPSPQHQQDELQRDIEAKARRLARFKTHIKQSIPSPLDQQPQPQQVLAKKEADETMDTEDAEPIIGACSEMCPESEREERERKGDLDKFERLDGDRNLTNKSLAVKKYNRTAERDAALIRSLPVLQKTVDHLLDLLNHSYDEDFLGMHNFLWDRMRAIRMDLRMQHIFNLEAITMHEQMIRFHIIAMHELCEYSTGEGFSEGFDAHLNIEQMNKTSVELFQMYDDHRKRGCPVPTEPEFRGYYALLKLDKHPGYKVETAELSLDLAKMTPDIRNTNEVLFAREVARASRAGNYIAFFRLARRATYLQACLMHAHFAKLRTQALASLHSGLQKNQGIPVAQVVKWLGMEGEDIEGLLEYHGFSLKQYEDAYMVKEGPFLNSDTDFPTKCSQLVHQKRSAKVVFDVFYSGQVPIMDGTWQAMKVLDVPVDDKSNRDTQSKESTLASIVPPEEEMPDYEEDGQLGYEDQVKQWQIHQEFGSHQTKKVEETDKLPVSLPIPNLGIEHVTPRSGAGKSKLRWSKSLQEHQPKKKRRNAFASELELEVNRSLIPVEECLVNIVERKDVSKPLFCDKAETHGAERVEDESVVIESELEEEKERLAMLMAEANRAKLKIILRKWKHQAAKKARNMRRMKAVKALNSLFLGPPVRSNKVNACCEELVAGIPRFPPSALELNIDQIIRERHKRHERMWSRLDVPEIIMPILKEKNPHAKCLCWKLVTCSRTQDKVGHSMEPCNLHSTMVGRWLRAKLMSNGEIDSKECKSNMSISKKWIATDTEDSGTHNLLSLSIVRDVAFVADNVENKEASLVGASGLLFLLVDNVRWDLERTKLQSLVRSVQPGSRLPLLILSSGNVEGISIENLLELHKLDRMRISSWSVILVRENENDDAKGFFSDYCLREGLLWLAHHAPLQPIVYPSDIRDLVLESLDPHLKALLNVNPSEVTPRDCISVFNQALERTESDIVSAVQNSLPGWPPPEINVLDDIVEGGVLNSYLPKSGWNVASNIDSIVHALRVCKLPDFPSLNWDPVSCGVKLQEYSSLNLHSQISTLDEIQEQKAFLEKSLCQYLSEISLARKGDLMMLKEADLMVQNNTTFECIGSRYLITPRWAPIFRKIYNWRLMLLASEPAPVAYVSRPRTILLAGNYVKNLISSARQVFISSGYATKVEPSLNEMLEANSRVISRGSRLAPTGQTMKDQFMQQAKEGNQESMVLDKITRQFKAAPVQSPLMSNFFLEEGGMEEINYQIPDLDERQYTIYIGQTEGELQLDKVATEFCEKVNEQIRKTALAVEGENTMCCPAIFNPAARKFVIDSTQDAERRVLPPGEMRRSDESGSENLPSNDIDCKMTICKPTWATNNGMDNLSTLLEQCNAVQSSIDKKLAVYFRGENYFQTG